MEGKRTRARFIKWAIAFAVFAGMSLAPMAVAQASYTLLSTKNNSYMGTVTSSPAGINCGTACSSDSADFASGTPVTLSASAATNYTFDHWTGDCSGTSATCNLTMSANKWANAVFDCKDRLIGHSILDFAPTPFTKDTYAAEGSPSSNFGSNNNVRVGANTSGDRYYSYVKGALPPVPQGCSAYAADLVFPNASAGPNGTVGLAINPASATWGEDTLTWNNRPTATGTGFTSLYGYQTTGIAAAVAEADVEDLYDGTQTNYGFVIKPDNVQAGYSWAMDSLEAGNPGGMIVAWK
jgi:uncharacterized repeat protein (TIGR02543 family)